MPRIIGNEEYLNILESCDYLGISRQTLRVHTREYGIVAFKQPVSKTIYYRKSDLDRLREMRPVDPSSEDMDS